MCHSGDPILIIAETLDFVLHGLKLNDESMINVPVFCSEQDHKKFVEYMKDKKDAGNSCKLEGSETTLGIEVTPGSITPSLKFKGITGAIYRRYFEKNAQKNVQRFFKREDEIIKSAQPVTVFSMSLFGYRPLEAPSVPPRIG